MTLNDWKQTVIATCPGSTRQIEQLKRFLSNFNEESKEEKLFIKSDNYGIIPYTKTITHDSLGHTVYIIKTKFNNKNIEFEMLNDSPWNIEQAIYTHSF